MMNILTSVEFSSAIIGALIGALIGGFFTWLAAYYTMKKQRKLDEEQRRAECMPLLRIELAEMLPDDNDFSVLGIENGELLTSANPDAEIVYTFLCVSPDVAAAFNFRVAAVYVEPFGIMNRSSAFAPLPVQLLRDERKMILFNYLDEIDSNIDIVIRFEYEDVLKNIYVQDAFFQYFETEYDDRKRKILEKREVLQPQLKGTAEGKKMNIKSLEEIVNIQKSSEKLLIWDERC